MENRLHLIVETPQPNLILGMKWLLGTYTVRFNRRHRVSGHLFAGRYQSQVVANEGDYFRIACDFVHLNPHLEGLIGEEQPLRAYAWSSLPSYLSPSSSPEWLKLTRLLEEVRSLSGDPDSDVERYLESKRHERLEDEFTLLRRSSCSCFGPRELQEQLRDHARGVQSAPQHATAVAERIIGRELARMCWNESEVVNSRKGDPRKVSLARCLRRESTVTLQWIAARLQMGAPTYLAHLLYWDARGERPMPRRRANRRETDARVFIAPPLPPVESQIAAPFFDPAFD
jgi:hypothetical protein